jgi:hypothetical protein
MVVRVTVKELTVDFRKHYLDNARFEFERMKRLGERAMEQIPGEEGFHFQLDDASNSIAVLVQHLSGNMVSRWTDFLTADGEKPTRQRDAEFEANRERSRDELMDIWQRGWSTLFKSLGALTADDLDKSVRIRGEELTVPEAIQRQITHASYHLGQLVYLARHVSGAEWKSLTSPKGQSQSAAGGYKKS